MSTGYCFFGADDGRHGFELWRSDGTSAGTVLVKDITRGASRSVLGNLTVVGSTLFFTAKDANQVVRLWKSDGTPAGTMMVKETLHGSESGNPFGLTSVDGTLFFSANDSSVGNELWTSDGSAAGTVMVKDIAPGAESSFPSNLANVNGSLFFAARDSMHGNEVWRSDGTAAGTEMVQDIASGPPSSNPSSFKVAGNYLFFSADDGNTGQELWAIRAGVDTYINAPAWVGAAPGGAAVIPVDYGNLGLTSAKALTLTATLDPALTFLGDTSGITPTITGQVVTWLLPPNALDEHGFALRVRAPDAAIGATFPVTLTLAADRETHASDNTVQMMVMIARQVYLPAVGR